MAVIQFATSRTTFDGNLHDDNPTARALIKHLPIRGQVQRWGDEIYLDVPVKMANTNPTLTVKVGDIAYWPEGPCLCIFFGKTPASRGDEPRPASGVTIIGHTDAPRELLRPIKAGTTITVTHAGPTEDPTV